MTNLPIQDIPDTAWPIQLVLTPAYGPQFKDADLLIAGSCTGFIYQPFHELAAGKTLLIGCSQLERTEIAERLEKIFRFNDIRSVTVCRMDTPCCGGMVAAVRQAAERYRPGIPIEVVVVSREGEVNP